MPAYVYLGGRHADPLTMYASGGDALTPEAMAEELDRTVTMTIGLFKMRSLRGADMERCTWTVNAARRRHLEVAVDLSQNLGNTPNRWSDSLEFCRRLQDLTGSRLSFLEEAVGPYDLGLEMLDEQRLDLFRQLRIAPVAVLDGLGEKAVGGDVVACRKVDAEDPLQIKAEGIVGDSKIATGHEHRSL